MQQQAHVRIAPEFFKHATRDYQNPVFAWVREVLQNAMDAKGCRNIFAEVTTTAKGCKLRVENDGKPMTQAILTDKFLALGASGKTQETEDSATVGCFGRAKEIILFCHDEGYEIRTGDYRVRGAGGDYTIEKVSHNFQGTVVAVGTEFDPDAVIAAFRKVVKLSSWSGKFEITIDGERFVISERLRVGKHRKSWEWGRVHTNDNADTERLVVRVNGIPMFTKWCAYGKGTVIIELTGRSTALLTSNRDSLLHPYSYDLDRLIAKISVDSRKAFSYERWHKRVYGKGMIEVRGPRSLQQRQEQKDMRVTLGGVVGTGLRELARKSDAQVEQISVEVPGAASDHAPVNHEVRGYEPQEVERETVETSFTTATGNTVTVDHEFVIKNGIHKDDLSERPIPARFIPTGKFSRYSRKLTSIWVKLLTTLHRLDGEDARFRVGFIFDNDILAEREQDAEGQVTYFLNPAVGGYRHYGSWQYSFTQRYRFTLHQAELLAKAAHEYAHRKGEGHDEDYARELTRVLALVFKHRQEFSACFK